MGLRLNSASKPMNNMMIPCILYQMLHFRVFTGQMVKMAQCKGF